MANIGIFDSGIGGLTVLRKLKAANNYFYFGDCLRAPYGNRSTEEIRDFSIQIVDFLETFEIDSYVIACNTISSIAGDFLEEKYQKSFLKITDAGARAVLENPGDALVLSTQATASSHIYKKLIGEKSHKEVYEIGAEGLADFVERGDFTSKRLYDLLGTYLKIANDKGIPNILLACTHFPLIEKQIGESLSYEAKILDPANYIEEAGGGASGEKNIKIYFSKLNENNIRISQDLFGIRPEEVKIV